MGTRLVEECNSCDPDPDIRFEKKNRKGPVKVLSLYVFLLCVEWKHKGLWV